MERLKNKTALITGGNSGIGLATAKQYASEGAQVIITGRREEALKDAVAEIGNGAEYLVADVSNLGDIDKLSSSLQSQGTTLDVIFVNAGVAKFAPFEETTEELYDYNFDINVKGAFFTVQKLLPQINDSASIIFNASIAAHKGLPGASVYGATKNALINLSKTISAELIGRGIRANVISPGPIETPIYAKLGMPEEALNDMATDFASRVPLQRFGSASEIATVATFLASGDSSFVVGEEIRVDGGFSTL